MARHVSRKRIKLGANSWLNVTTKNGQPTKTSLSTKSGRITRTTYPSGASMTTTNSGTGWFKREYKTYKTKPVKFSIPKKTKKTETKKEQSVSSQKIVKDIYPNKTKKTETKKEQSVSSQKIVKDIYNNVEAATLSTKDKAMGFMVLFAASLPYAFYSIDSAMAVIISYVLVGVIAGKIGEMDVKESLTITALLPFGLFIHPIGWLILIIVNAIMFLFG